ncbi:hypothetical protein, partial [Ornithobacterium rhinotracheale]
RFRESLQSELESDSFQKAEANPVPLGKPQPSLLTFSFHILLLQVFARLWVKPKEQGRRSLQKRSMWSNRKERVDLALQKGNTIQNPV